MVDGKICNILTDTSSAMRCFLCNASPKEMNNLKSIINKEIVNNDYYSFGFPLYIV